MHQASRANKHQRLVKKKTHSVIGKLSDYMIRQTKNKKDEIMKNVPLTVIYQKIKYDAPGTILQERKWYQLCSCVFKNFPFVNAVGKFTTVTYIARDNPNSGSFSRPPKGKYLEKLQLTPILTVAVKVGTSCHKRWNFLTFCVKIVWK